MDGGIYLFGAREVHLEAHITAPCRLARCAMRFGRLLSLLTQRKGRAAASPVAGTINGRLLCLDLFFFSSLAFLPSFHSRSFRLTPCFQVSVEDVINGKHLPPLGRKEFEEYLLYKEYSIENL
jgi:hypothetical protein